ncbi:hypothetical protein Lal_00039565 [Lupinus albus]|nr:hypothetical protein Lal_00039565 [Lupinus albus]
MGIYKITGIWMYQEDYRTNVDLDLSDNEISADQQEQPTAQPEAPEASQTPPFGLAHLDALEQRLNQRVDAGLQALNDNMDSGMINMYDRLAADIQRENDQTWGEIDKIAFILQTMSTGSNPPPTNKPRLLLPQLKKKGGVNTHKPNSLIKLFLSSTVSRFVIIKKGEIEIESTSQIATSVSCLCFDEDKADLKSLKTGHIYF